MIAAGDALERLRAGNARAVAGRPTASWDQERRRALIDGQRPFAVILGCADSRVAPEMIFDQSIGDLFVVRVAGNVASPEVIGSVEFAVTQLAVRLVVVKGHEGCGAVRAAMDQPGAVTPSLAAILDRIRPHIRSVVESGLDDAGRGAVEANVRATVDQLRGACDTQDAEVAIVGAVYSLRSGEVAFLD